MNIILLYWGVGVSIVLNVLGLLFAWRRRRISRNYREYRLSRAIEEAQKVCTSKFFPKDNLGRVHLPQIAFARQRVVRCRDLGENLAFGLPSPSYRWALKGFVESVGDLLDSIEAFERDIETCSVDVSKTRDSVVGALEIFNYITWLLSKKFRL